MDEIAAFAQKFDDGVRVGEEKGKKEGEKQAKIAVAREMLSDKVDINTIAKFTGLSINEIKDLQE
jgi:predicted transposase/invertase (TIGR01784 family)